MENSELLTIVAQFKFLYISLGVLTLGASFGGAWAVVRFGVGRNAGDISKLGGDVNTLYERTNTHRADIARLEERSVAINEKLDLIHAEITKR